MLPETLDVRLVHCGSPMRAAGGGFTWEGEDEITRGYFSCATCGLRVTVMARQHVGPPGGA